MAVYNNASAIDIASMYAPDNPGVDSLKLWCPQVSGVTDPAARRNTLGLVVIRSRMDSPDVGFGLELPARTTVKLAVFDIAGRRRTTLLDRELPAGLTSLVWNGQDESGGRVASGVYFVRLSCENGTRVSKLIMLR